MPYLFLTRPSGVFWVLFIRCNEVLWRRSKARDETLFKPIFIVAWVLFGTITAHLIIDIYASFKAFILPQDETIIIEAGQMNPAQLFYMSLDHPSNVAYSALYVAATLLADGFLIYRLYIVWSYNRPITILPILLWISLFITGTVTTWLFQHSRQTIFGVSRRWILACFSITFLCNFYCTTLIAFRVAMSQRNLRVMDTAPSGLSKILEILIQSAALYGVLVILSLAFMIISSNVVWITVGMTNPVIGVIFCMIVTRTHSHLTQQAVSASYARHMSAPMGSGGQVATVKGQTSPPPPPPVAGPIVTIVMKRRVHEDHTPTPTPVALMSTTDVRDSGESSPPDSPLDHRPLTPYTGAEAV
ncbi:hypothetical protein NLJ89_g1192 [Agrocybe chaxingu]|uniref:Transmembrane protein n=1 Tax=Agrocybe chaxingu TaxID=84603 RepID=A0A9W8N0L6_9AGAR|nr:hypothetical protein NLJ89_g1192 [Agrocybe chaxingu]